VNLPFFSVERIADAPARDFGQDKQDGIDRLLVALHGWSHSQSDPASPGIRPVSQAFDSGLCGRGCAGLRGG
jgi:hypothetical protein